MSGMIAGGVSVSIVENTGNGMKCEMHKSRLHSVLAMIDNGALGGGWDYGCPQHIDALIEVERQIVETRATIKRCLAEDAERAITEATP